MDIKARRGDADLAIVAELANHRRLSHLVDVGVGEDNKRRVATKLEAQTLDLVGQRRISSLPTWVDPVKLILRIRGMLWKASAIGQGRPITRFGRAGQYP